MNMQIRQVKNCKNRNQAGMSVVCVANQDCEKNELTWQSVGGCQFRKICYNKPRRKYSHNPNSGHLNTGNV